MKYKNFFLRAVNLLLILGILWQYQQVALVRAAAVSQRKQEIAEVEAYNASVLQAQSAAEAEQSQSGYRDGDYMDLFPQGDMNDLTLTLNRIGLENLLSYWAPVDEYYAYLLEAAYRNLHDFHITYRLQRPIPEMAQVMPGIYIGPMYDGNQQLMNEAATVNLFWEKGQMNMTLDDKVILEDENGPGPQFYVDIAGLQVDKGRTPGSYVFTGEQSFTDRQYGPVEVRIREGRYNAAGTVAVWLEIVWNENVYELDFQKGVRQWDFQSLKVKSSEKTIILKK